MYVCLCKGVTCRQIKEVVGKSVYSMKDLAQQLGVATQCGRCGQDARDLLKSTLTLNTPYKAA
ncbi:(2Fe-2S)-binding protein [Permianibacter aggregans]|uniref:Bacterioferritin-associated ferredoxin n=1 Tax=Permianibacter aggregans TaxID=1510150 RepID=A0A4R6UM12_9GAMM|nr:(2Fe-2S)-binding protein [Permianibacter aggregans]QGX41044.1 (2Fe-2S)-binding protein [Permianibacter aggregans]TDQ48108.1 bacterioferritin-associated ferredoxin [Permianibacter aggregans]